MGGPLGGAGRPTRRALGITLVYVAVGAAWILLSDYAAEVLAGEISHLAAFQRAKGLGYIAATGLALFLMIRHGMKRIDSTAGSLRKSRQHAARLGEYLNAVVEAAPLAVFDITADGRIASIWNPAAERLFGVTRSEALGLRLQLTTGSIGSLAGQIRHRIDPTADLNGIGSPRSVEMDLRRADGSTFPAVVAAAQVETSGTMVVIVSDVTRLHRTADELRTALAERGVLLSEVHHRVKNNLQIISSLLSLEVRSGAPPETELVLARTRARIRAISAVHEQLYDHENLAEVDLSRYFRELCAEITRAYDPERAAALRLDCDPVMTDSERAIPLGLLLHELLWRALEDNTEARAFGEVVVGLTDAQDGFEFSVTSRGCDPPGSPWSEKGPLIQTLILQLRATVTEDSERTIRLYLAQPDLPIESTRSRE